ncbi:hypothetical protein [Actinocorallia populi]|uniref:hypothetical protein n=1 Tax=Actinocorallia populi TaxID=2079200 RepID=UPI0018E59AD4|nr:hypothetical protein [Actinocorallia populi]
MGDLDRAALAVLGREWMLHGHLQDRVGIPLAIELGGPEMMEEVSIEEWTAASPVYTRRLRRAMGITGDDVTAIFKGLQFDIGFPHQFLDVRYELADPEHGTFRLASCGALLDVEPLGDEMVRTMCHAIEDPTFPATGRVTNPRSQVLPVHRPPRVPADRSPHCEWAVTVDGKTDSQPHPNEAVVAASLAATVGLPVPASDPRAEPGGWDDYSGAFDAGFELEDLSHAGLQTALAEIAMASHLLVHGFMLSMEQRFGIAAARTAASRVLIGLGALTSQRLASALRTGAGAAGIAKLLRIHPVFAPAGYVDISVDLLDEERVRFALLDCPAVREPADRTWFAGWRDGDGGTDAFAALVRGADPRAQVARSQAGAGEHIAFDILVDPASPAAPDPAELALARLSTGARFLFRRRRPVRRPSAAAGGHRP